MYMYIYININIDVCIYVYIYININMKKQTCMYTHIIVSGIRHARSDADLHANADVFRPLVYIS